VEHLPTLVLALANFVRLIRFHLAPLTCHTRFRRQIEAALALYLHRQPGIVGTFQDVGIRSAPRRTGEKPIDVRCQSSALLLGLPARLET
jgi:hypothetical protein